MHPAYLSKHNLSHKTQIIILMILNEEESNYLLVKKLSALLRGITSKHVGDFYCLNCLHSFRTKPQLEYHKEACEIKIFFTLFSRRH